MQVNGIKSFAIFVLLAAFPAVAIAGELPITSEGGCQTASTEWDGVCHTCQTTVCLTAPEGSALKPGAWSVDTLAGGGSAIDCGQPTVTRTQTDGFGVTTMQVCIKPTVTSPFGFQRKPGVVRCRINGIRRA